MMRYMSQQVFVEAIHFKVIDSWRDLPTEDTFLLLDGLEADAKALKELQATVCLEIG